MPPTRSGRRFLLPLGCALALVAVGNALALQKPGRTIVRDGQVRLVALNQASFAFMVARSKTDCDHVELWNTDTKGVWRFGKAGPCTNLGSTGAGITSVGVSGNRALWVRYNGGNIRDWQLMTATTTQKTPKQLRFAPQDVELPSPFVIGDATGGMGIPYAAGKEVVLLGTSGVAVFKHTDPARIVAVTSGKGPAGAVVAALRETGEVVMLKSDGSVAWTVQYQPGAVKAIALAPAGLVAQLPGSVQIRRPAGSSVARPAAGGCHDRFRRRPDPVHAERRYPRLQDLERERHASVEGRCRGPCDLRDGGHPRARLGTGHIRQLRLRWLHRLLAVVQSRGVASASRRVRFGRDRVCARYRS